MVTRNPPQIRIPPDQLKPVLNVLARAQVTVGEATQIHATVQKLIAMVNQPYDIVTEIPVVLDDDDYHAESDGVR